MDEKITLNELLKTLSGHIPPLYISNGSSDDAYDEYIDGTDRETICRSLYNEETLLFALHPCDALYLPARYLKEEYANAVIDDVICFPDGWIVFVEAV